MSILKLGTAEIERLICDPASLGSLELLMPRVGDAWSKAFPSLSSLSSSGGTEKVLRICVATEDIVGPVRNGGIGTTYAALAEMLAGLGFDTTILYLRGQEVENGTIEEWVEYYGKKGVKFVPVPNYAAADRFQTGADRWLRAPYNMLRYLLEHPMDVVHVSEWRGSSYLSLLAKRQGLAFSETLFLVKTSSPWLWNRIYGSQPLDRLEDLSKIQAERCSVEYADMVIGGSLHLLQWMASQGYQIPESKTFVQPNVVIFEHLKPLMSKRSTAGCRVTIDEFVFFGRLEGRKGLLIFCQAIKRLIRAGHKLPPKITFLGKPGARLTSRPDQDITEFINTETADWPSSVQIISDYQQYEALEYLLGGTRLAIMPSIIENSSLAVYEAAICGIPFIASNSGGTPELVLAEDHDEVLCAAHPIPLSALMLNALAKGAFIARPSFDNDINLEIWRNFHLELGRGLAKQLMDQSKPAQAPIERTVSVCIYFQNNLDQLRITLQSLAKQELKPCSVAIAVDGPNMGLLDVAKQAADESGIEATIVECFDLDAGLSFNKAADTVSGDYILFLWAGVTLRPNATRALLKVAQSSGADLVNFFYRLTWNEGGQVHDYLKAYIIGSITEAFFHVDVESIPFMVSKKAFDSTSKFSSDYRVIGHDHEFIAKALVMGLKCQTVLLELGTVPAWDKDWLYRECYDRSTTLFRAIRPQIAAVPLAIRELLLMSKGLQLKPMPKAKGAGSNRQLRVAKPATANYFNRMMISFLGDNDDITTIGLNTQDKLKPDSLVPREAKQQRLASKLIGGAKLLDATSVKKENGRPPASIIDRYDGTRGVIGLFKGRLYGFVNGDPSNGDASPIQVCLKDGMTVIDQQIASAVIPTVSGRANNAHGFIFDLRTLKRWHKRLRPWHLSVFEVSSNKLVGSVVVPGLDKRLSAYGLEGFCDLGEGPIVRGWVWDPSDPLQNFDVSVYIDERFLTKVSASSKRLDLEAAGIGHGSFGFKVPIPRPLRDGSPHDIDVIVSKYGLFLKRGRLNLKGDNLAFR